MLRLETESRFQPDQRGPDPCRKPRNPDVERLKRVVDRHRPSREDQACSVLKPSPPGGARPLALDDAHALDPARIGVEHVELEAGNGVDDLAAGRHPAERVEDHAANGVDCLAVLAS